MANLLNGLFYNKKLFFSDIFTASVVHTLYLVIQEFISAFMTKFVQLPKIKSSNDVSNLRKIYDEVEFSVQNLKFWKVETSSYGSLLVPLLNE